MIGPVSRTLMALAVRCLGDHRRDWAEAMQAEFDAAREDGRPLAFAVGCLRAAARQLPSHPAGRLAIASHLVALVLIVPAGALLVASIITGFPASYFDLVGVYAVGVSGLSTPLLSGANQSAIPPLLVLVISLAALHLRLAWLALDGDRVRLCAAAAMSAAVTLTLVIFGAVVFADYVAATAQASVLTVELLALFVLERWRARLQSTAALHRGARQLRLRD
jgi:hypothetical protein